MNARQLVDLGSGVVGGVIITGAVLMMGARLVGQRPRLLDVSPPVPVSLVTPPRERAAPSPEPRREPEPPRQPPRVDVTPQLPVPALTPPELPSPAVVLDPALLGAPAVHRAWVFDVSELDQPPREVVNPDPVYPFKALQRRIEGQVRVRFLVHRDGTVGDIVIVDAHPPGVFEVAVREGVSHWRFEPGRLAGEAVDTWVAQTITFHLDAGRK